MYQPKKADAIFVASAQSDRKKCPLPFKANLCTQAGPSFSSPFKGEVGRGMGESDRFSAPLNA